MLTEKPTKAAEGFARGQGVDVADLVVASTEKGEYVSVTKRIVGCPTAEILVEILPGSSAPFLSASQCAGQIWMCALPGRCIGSLPYSTAWSFRFLSAR